MSDEDINDAYSAYAECMLEEYNKKHKDSKKIIFLQIFKIKKNSIANILYSIKYLLCIFLELNPKEKHGKDYELDLVEVANIEYNTLYAGWESTDAYAGRGLFKNWFYQINSDGDWNM